MNVLEIAHFALRGVAANKLRSGLTVLGMLIGVAAVILLVAVGNGTQQQVQQTIDRLGTNTLTVMGGNFARRAAAAANGPQSQNQDLTLADAAALADPSGAPDVRSVSPVVTTQQTATYAGASHAIGQVVGTYPSYFAATNSPIGRGAYFTDDDVTAARKVVVIGQTVATDLFGSVDPVGKRVLLGGVPFTVVGVLADKGSAGVNDPNDVAIAPLSTMQQSLTGYGSLSSIIVSATGPGTVDAAQAEITSILDQRHHVTDPSQTPFLILNQAQLLSTRTQTAAMFTVLLGAVAGISLLVGGIGITNIMLVTVTERTREIGIRKALGAPRTAVLAQFLGEATVLSLLGGLLGVAVGVVGSRFTVAGIRPAIVPGSIVLALGVSLAIGLFFGSYPAHRAASLRPIEALRYE